MMTYVTRKKMMIFGFVIAGLLLLVLLVHGGKLVVAKVEQESQEACLQYLIEEKNHDHAQNYEISIFYTDGQEENPTYSVREAYQLLEH